VAALVVTVLAAMVAPPARAAGVAGVTEAAPVAGEGAAPAAVVGLDADAPEQGAVLTAALRRAFALRGLSGGKEANLSELRLALGCKRDTPECLARGGKLLDARRLIYGTLRRGKGGWTLDVTLLEVEGGKTVTASSVPLVDADLEPARIDATADAIAERLAPEAAAAAAPERGWADLKSPPPPPPEPMLKPEEPRDEGAAAAGGEGKLRWGWVRPQPPWKWVGFGVGLGLAVPTLAATLGMGVWLTSSRTGFRPKLLEVAAESLLDSNMNNDVDPASSDNLCARAEETPTNPDGSLVGEPGQVRNGKMAKLCRDADFVRRAQVGTAVVGAIGLATTAVFTVLLFVHREPATKTAKAWRRRGLHMGLDPAQRGQGFALRVGGRF
jgi:hypothetical protein